MGIKDLFRRSSSKPVVAREVSLALDRVRQRLSASPLTFSALLSEMSSKKIYCKWETKFKTGSFKERGAVNFLLQLSDSERKRGVCLASAGNHALAVSCHAQALGIPCTVFMPETAPAVKVDRTERFGASIRLQGQEFSDAYQAAKDFARHEGSVFVPPFDHPRIISGQGTLGLELLDQVPRMQAIVVSVGGGGLAAGICLAVKEKRPDVQIFGVRTEWTQGERRKDGMFPPEGSIADGIAVKSIGEHTGPILEKHLSDMITVSEEEIASAVVSFLETERALVEGAAAASLAAVLKGALPTELEEVVLVLGGANIDKNLLSRLIDRDMSREGKLFRLRVSVPDSPGSLAALTKMISSQGANILETFHDRFFSPGPRLVNITFVLEVRNRQHQDGLLETLANAGLNASVLSSS